MVAQRAGIRPDENNPVHMTVSPQLPPDLDWLEISYQADGNPISINAQRTDHGIKLETNR